MEQQNNYPNITYEQVFNIYTIIQNMRKDKAYIEKSPYAEPIKKAINLITFTGESKTLDTEIDTSDLDIRKESEILYKQTKALLNSHELDEKDKASVLKTATTLLEKLLSLIERSENIQYMREFETRVLQIMKKVTPEQREQFLNELKTGGDE
jgi:hypothetical protein